jgi:hypothetical protein
MQPRYHDIIVDPSLSVGSNQDSTRTDGSDIDDLAALLTERRMSSVGMIKV